MNLLIIGSSVVDEVYQNNIIEIKAGGIFYTIVGLLFSSNYKMNIDLLTNYSDDFEFYFKPIYNQVNLIKHSLNNFMPNVKLNVYEEREREETYSGFANSLTIHNEMELNNYDAILINMISGIDISLEEIKKLRKLFKGIIYLDIHSLARGFDDQNKRVFRQIEHSAEWLNSADIVQCNENELFTLGNSRNKDLIIDQALKTNLKHLIVTKGKNGADIYSNTQSISQETSSTINAINTVGCGDIFGAVFFSSYISTNDINLSLKQSVKISSHFTQFKNVYDFLDKGVDIYD